jgi:hypothetical protein
MRRGDGCVRGDKCVRRPATIPAERDADLTRLDGIEVHVVRAARRLSSESIRVVVLDVVGAGVQQIEHAGLPERELVPGSTVIVVPRASLLWKPSPPLR